jgi:Mg-chelatase subunit ChlI
MRMMTRRRPRKTRRRRRRKARRRRPRKTRRRRRRKATKEDEEEETKEDEEEEKNDKPTQGKKKRAEKIDWRNVTLDLTIGDDAMMYKAAVQYMYSWLESRLINATKSKRIHQEHNSCDCFR